MTLQELQEIQKDMKSITGKSSRGLQDIEGYFQDTSYGVLRFKAKANESFKFILPKQLRLPFNPYNLASKEYNTKSPFVFPKSVTTSILLIKLAMQENETLKEFIASKAGLPADTKDFDDLTKVTDLDKKIFGPYIQLVHYSDKVYKINMPEFGKFGGTFLARVETDEAGVIVKGDEIYKYAELAYAMSQEHLRKFKASKENDPEWEKMADTVKSKALQAERSKQLISLPMRIGFSQVIAIPCDVNGNITDAKFSPENLNKYTRLMKIGKKDLTEQYGNLLGQAVDVSIDYLEVDVDFKEEGDMGVANIYTDKTVNKNPQQRITAVHPTFVDSYRIYRDDEEIFDDNEVIRSAWELRPADVNLVARAFSNNINEKLITNQMVEKYRDIITSTPAAMAIFKKSVKNELVDGDALTSEFKIEEEDGFEDIDLEGATEVIADLDK